MPLYRFSIATPLPPEAVSEKIRALTRSPRGFRETLTRSFHPASGPPFLGTIEGQTFRLHRDIAYRSTSLPLIRGRIHPRGTGSDVDVLMLLHPLTVVLLALWFAITGIGAWRAFAPTSAASTANKALILAVLVFGGLVAVWGFFPEAMKARRMLEEALGNTAGPKSAVQS